MRIRKKELPNSKLIARALAIFLTTAFVAIIINSFGLGYGFHLNYSISKYVGLEAWSVIMFALGNCFVVAYFGKYLWKLGEAWKMPKLFYALIIVMVVGLVALSVFPVGYFDTDGHKSIVSFLHEISSRTMFLAMMAEAALIAIWKKAGRLAHALCVAYVVYATICIIGYFTKGAWFLPLIMIYETLYLAMFMVMLALCGIRDAEPIPQIGK